MPGWLTWGVTFAALVAVTGAAVWTRVAPSRDEVMRGEHVRLLGADAYYHLRHTRAAASDQLLRWDPGTHYPHGQRSRNAATFDLVGAAIVRATAEPVKAPATVAGGTETTYDDDDVATVIAALPPALAGLTVMALFVVGLMLRGRLCGLVMATFVLLYPGEMGVKDLFGFADHHALEAFLVTSVLAALAVALVATDARRIARRAAIAGVITSLYFVSWAGAPLILAAIGLALLAAWAVEVMAGRPPRAARVTGTVYFAAFAAVTAATGMLAPDAILIPALFAPTAIAAVIAAVAFGASAPVAAWIQGGAPRRRALALVPALAPVALLAVAAALVGPVHDAVRVAFSKASTVSEHHGHGLWQLYGTMAVLAPVGGLAALVRAWRRQGRSSEVAIAVAAAVIGLMAIGSGDYGYLLAPMLGILATLGAWVLACSMARVSPTPAPALRAAAAAIVAAGVVTPVAAGWTAPPMPTTDAVRAMMVFDDAWASATTWLRDETPPIPLDIDREPAAFGDAPGGFPYPDGSYAVLVPWSYGNQVAAKSWRPVAWSQGINADIARMLTSASEATAMDYLTHGARPGAGVRYVAVDARTAGPQARSLFQEAGSDLRAEGLHRRIILGRRRIELGSYGEAFHRSLVARLYLDDGSGLAHLRLVYETPEESLVGYRYRDSTHSYGRLALPVTADNRSDMERLASARLPSPSPYGFVYDARIEPTIKIFEVVPGAHLVGTAPPGAAVTVTLALRGPASRRGQARTVTYQQHGSADERGRFELVVPYSTEADAPTAVAATGPYQLQIAGESTGVRVTVPAAAVAEGGRVQVPPLPAH